MNDGYEFENTTAESSLHIHLPNAIMKKYLAVQPIQAHGLHHSTAFVKPSTIRVVDLKETLIRDQKGIGMGRMAHLSLPPSLLNISLRLLSRPPKSLIIL